MFALETAKLLVFGQKMITGALLYTRNVFLRRKADREEEGQVLNLGEFDARFTMLQI